MKSLRMMTEEMGERSSRPGGTSRMERPGRDTAQLWAGYMKSPSYTHIQPSQWKPLMQVWLIHNYTRSRKDKEKQCQGWGWGWRGWGKEGMTYRGEGRGPKTYPYLFVMESWQITSKTEQSRSDNPNKIETFKIYQLKDWTGFQGWGK